MYKEKQTVRNLAAKKRAMIAQAERLEEEARTAARKASIGKPRANIAFSASAPANMQAHGGVGAPGTCAAAAWDTAGVFLAQTDDGVAGAQEYARGLTMTAIGGEGGGCGGEAQAPPWTDDPQRAIWKDEMAVDPKAPSATYLFYYLADYGVNSPEQALAQSVER